MTNQREEPKGAGDPRHYQACRTDEQRKERLGIRRMARDTDEPSYRYEPPYDYLMDIVYDGRHGTWIELLYSSEKLPVSSSLTVKITGRNLQPITEAIAERTCEFIQEYQPHRFLLPHPDVPVITKIELVVNREDELLLAKGEGKH